VVVTGTGLMGGSHLRVWNEQLELQNFTAPAPTFPGGIVVG
jgi:hypothetical protein